MGGLLSKKKDAKDKSMLLSILLIEPAHSVDTLFKVPIQIEGQQGLIKVSALVDLQLWLSDMTCLTVSFSVVLVLKPGVILGLSLIQKHADIIDIKNLTVDTDLSP